MLIMPAIDLYEGKAVRLKRGDYREMTVYSEHPRELMDAFAEQGAKAVHVVDLEGARDGNTANLPLIRKLKQGSSLLMEVGGGIRTMETMEMYLSGGVSRVILGSIALKDPALVEAAVKEYGERIAVGIDAKDGFVAVEGWLDSSTVDYLSLAREMEKIGVRTVIFTDISKDGTLSGVNAAQLSALHDAVSMNVIASGGVHTMEDIRICQKMGLYGTIAGKSLYQGTLDLAEAVAYTRSNA